MGHLWTDELCFWSFGKSYVRGPDNFACLKRSVVKKEEERLDDEGLGKAMGCLRLKSNGTEEKTQRHTKNIPRTRSAGG